jgi:energy-coupling factor transport system substrate-specific component
LASIIGKFTLATVSSIFVPQLKMRYLVAPSDRNLSNQMAQDEPIEPLDDEISPASSRMATIALIPSAVAFNIALAEIALALKLPVYLDCVGIITTTLLAGLVPGLIVTALAFGITALLFNPSIIFFTGTAAMMAIATHYLAMIGGFRNMFRTVLSGLVLGVISALVSLPVSVIVFGGVTTAGSTGVTAWFIHCGFSVWAANFLSGMACDATTDKVAEALLAVWLIRAVPYDLRARFRGPYLAKNFKTRDEHVPGFPVVPSTTTGAAKSDQSNPT